HRAAPKAPRESIRERKRALEKLQGDSGLECVAVSLLIQTPVAHKPEILLWVSTAPIFPRYHCATTSPT
ncbi:unnamed protein product, partial [Ectocarpus sp. 12 AP-2014]